MTRLALGFMGVLVLLLAAFWAADATGGSADCEFIKDSDMRHYCRAISKDHRTWCEWIQQGDLRARCRWEVDLRKERARRGEGPR